jgi:hypothetical protein
MLACFTLGWIAGCTSAAAAPDAGSGVCPVLRLTAKEAGGCTAPDGGSIDSVTLPSGCEGPPGGGASFDRTIFEDQPSLMVDDDDCKYRFVFTRACPSSSRDMSFLLNAKKRADESPATGGTPSILAYQGLAHPAPNANTVASELEPGTYSISPVLFDRPGTWTLELHLFEHCPYGPGSPHGHANFEVDIP